MVKYRVEKFKLIDWEDAITGLIIAENKDWILTKAISADYVVDGYNLINKRYIEERLREKHEKQVERVLKLKGITIDVPQAFKFGDTVTLLSWVENKYEFFAFQDDIETESFYGKVNRFEEDMLTIDFINANGIEKKNWHHFDIEKIRIICFDSDYFNSIKLLWKDNRYF